MPFGFFKNYVTRHNFGPSLTIIMNDGYQYFKYIYIYMSIFFNNAMCYDFNRWMTINDVNMTS